MLRNLCLTDMWKAAGEPESKRPAEWARKEGAEFIAFLADAENVAVGHIIRGVRGRNGSTWAHWQIGLAYAKYLSPEFHAWCNRVVRTHMEGRPAFGMTDDRRAEGALKIRITAMNASTRFLGEARRNGGPRYAAQLMPDVLAMLGIRVPVGITPDPLRQGELFQALPDGRQS